MKIRYFDYQMVWHSLRQWASEAALRHPEVEKIIAFGSLVRREAVPGSDVDVILIVEESPLPFRERIPHYMPEAFPVGMDVFPYTRAEVENMMREGNLVLKRALGEGIVIFERG
ncbi:MAG: nucleotidyltransferase domain-containing protein [Chloroflexi bacterium]|nr:nucleotidyltransferase domain-containing protein [Chloroflexota bacterium]